MALLRADTGLASFILRNFDAGAWRSRAEGRWLVAGTQAAKRHSLVL
jgi:hypothetical protein